MAVVNKQFQVKVFDKADTFIKTYSPKTIVKDIAFKSEINGGFGQASIILDLPFDDFDEGNSIEFENIVRIYQVDEDNPKGRLIYTGFISEYIPSSIGTRQQVEIRCVGLISLLQRAFYKNGASFTVTRTTDDPEVIFKAIIDQFNTIYTASLISYSGGNIDTVGTAISITFDRRKWLEALKDTFGAVGSGWWWKIDLDGQVFLKAKPATATHSFIFQKHIESAWVRKTSEDIINDVRVEFSTGTADDNDATSKTDFNEHEAYFKRLDLTDATAAAQLADQLINDNKDPKISAKLVINSSFDIETVKVGDTCKVLGIKKGSTLFGNNMQIVSIVYNIDTITIELEEITDQFGTEMEKFIVNPAE